MMDAVDKYNPDFIYTDGTDQQPFSGSGTGTGYKCDAMQRVIADFYNKTLDRWGKLLYHRLRFTVGKDGAIYAWCMTVPKAGDKLHIPADTRSAFPVISVQSPVSIQCCWQS